MIHLKICLNKNVIKQAIIFLFLVISIMIFISFYKKTNYEYKTEQEKEIYRTLNIKFYNEEEVKNIISALKLDIKDRGDVEYIITFKSVKEMNEFIEKNNDKIATLSIQPFNDNTYKISIKVISIIIVLCSVLIMILIFTFSLNFIYNMEKDIFLYKLLGFKTSNIILYLSGFILLFYILVYVIGYILSLLVLKILIYYDVVSSFLNVYELGLLFIGMILLIFLSLIRVIVKIRKISAISLIKSY